MRLPTGSRLGPYEILAAIGAGGMGEVYRARDTRLDRTVAIKVLAPQIANDAELRERFEREARSISALDHPHICALYDVGEADGTPFLVMQYLEGETLADRLTRQPMTIDEALQAATEMAGALAAAHRRGIVHRDLKPGNVMMTASGTGSRGSPQVKLLDFGLAKIAQPYGPVPGVTVAATRSAPLTTQGSLLGTLQYMSPEQLEGREADARSDIFAFGAILYEMLTGRRAFDSGSQAGIIAAILATEPQPIGDTPAIRGLPPAASRTLDRLLKKCLAKKADDRWQSAADLADELTWIDEERRRGTPLDESASSVARPTRLPSRARGRWLVAMTIAAILTTLALGMWVWSRSTPVNEPIRFSIQAPDANSFAAGPSMLAISPDGRSLAFVTGVGSDRYQLWVRPLGSLSAHLLPGTDLAWNPLWSPDGRYVAFTTGNTGGRMKKIDVRGGSPITLADWGYANAWSPQGQILFRGRDGRLYRIADEGGTPTAVTTLDKGQSEAGHNAAFFLRDGRRFMLHAQSTDISRNAWYIASIDNATRTRLPGLNGVLSFMVYGSGHVLYQRDGTLMAQRFDDNVGQLVGDAIPIVENINYNPGNGRAAMSVSTDGVLAYRTGANFAASTLTWLDGTGKTVGTIPFEGGYVGLPRPFMSPDGHRIVVTRREETGARDIWMIDIDRGIPTRLTFDPADDDNPIWSPDGQHIVFKSLRNGRTGDLYQRASSAGGGDEILFESPEAKRPYAMSPDSKVLLFGRTGATTGEDLWALPLTGERKPFPVVVTPYQEGYASFSPDGRWFTYCVNDSPPDQVYVEPFPPNGTRVRLSTTSGSSPLWSRDGTKIFYMSQEGHLMSVDVTTDGGAFHAGTPQDLYTSPPSLAFSHFGFAIDSTGTRFLLPVAKQEQTAAPITLVLNWTAGLTQR